MPKLGAWTTKKKKKNTKKKKKIKFKKKKNTQKKKVMMPNSCFHRDSSEKQRSVLEDRN